MPSVSFSSSSFDLMESQAERISMLFRSNLPLAVKISWYADCNELRAGFRRVLSWEIVSVTERVAGCPVTVSFAL